MRQHGQWRLWLILIGMAGLALAQSTSGPYRKFFSEPRAILGFNRFTATTALDSTRGWRDTVVAVVDLRQVPSDSLMVTLTPVDTFAGPPRKTVWEYQPVLFADNPPNQTVTDTLDPYTRITWQRLGTSNSDTVRGRSIDTLHFVNLWRGWGDGLRVRGRTFLADSSGAGSLTRSGMFELDVRSGITTTTRGTP